MWEDFKKFALKGNVLDLAVGVIIGGAFGKIVTSLVNDIIMPIVSLLIGKVDFNELHYHQIKYGSFIQNIVDFFIIAFSIFIFIRVITKLNYKKKQEEVVEESVPVETTEDLLKDIRALLQEKK
ncbi:large conductance mechanosensitive channel protein MscL [Rummeliibacillus sp. TYF005]|uniref:large conductance mechanosensitive channel protein MscL n=1 Tax=unclassified Rummeliibacillus TaxID=2622809 RepID=UPI000E669CD6|nr:MULTISPECIES: large conductance mechanosensitive channel protein MscL [unclassified Rummeliibacillus]RIJ64847.1 large conductance mechanosensitive channel protein MscL [Rummeliibacillus sp. POC4]RPJ97443.1 large conductance mechanosensitive channel protein MscL [Rummeliibacillus sp. TYF005]